MKKINLRDYYPFYTTDTIVEVPDEVADLLHEYKLNEAAYILRTYRHKAYFSLDYDANVERDALVIVLTPADILERKEENARLYQALASLPEKQRNRILQKRRAPIRAELLALSMPACEVWKSF